MNKFENHIINASATIKDALGMLNCLSGKTLILFVVNDDDIMIGTLTDGDIRRNLIDGLSVDSLVKYAMHSSFKYISNPKNDVRIIREYRKRGFSLLPYLDGNNRIIDILDLKQCLSFLPIDAVLMAGGKGERLRPLTNNIPKPLLKVGDKAIIDYNVEKLFSYGIKHISVTVNYLKEQIEEHFRNTSVNCIREPKFLGTIGSIKFIKIFYNDTILIMNSDLFTNIDFESFFLHFVDNNADMSVAVIPYGVNVPYGVFEIDNGNIIGIKEKPTYNYYANAGIYLIKKEMINSIPDDIYFDATDLIYSLISMGKKIIYFPITGYWVDIGKKEDYEKAEEMIKYL